MKNLSFIFLLVSLLFGGNEEVDKTINFDRTITGVVYLDGDGEAIGANIVVDGDEGIGTVTEFDGTFSLSVPETAKALKINYTGYAEKIVFIEDTSHIVVFLDQDNLLEEVVVTSSAPRRYESVASASVATINSEEISNMAGSPGASSKTSNRNKSKKKDQTTWKRSGKVANTATLFVGDDEQLPIKGTQIAVTVDGFRARVLIDCFFYNNEKLQREGTFKMKLPQGAIPYYFAFGESVYKRKGSDNGRIPFVDYKQLDFSPEGIENMRSSTWTNPKEARVVEKEKAAFAYNSEVAQKVDPALAEWAGADIYNCRVFPLLPKKLHRIVIGYDMNLDQLDEDWLLNFGIPKVKCPKIIDFEIAEFPNVNSEISPEQDVKIENGYKRFRMTNPKAKEISIRYQELGNMILKSNAETEKDYFAASISPSLTQTEAQSLFDKGIIALDVSLSSSPDKFNIWLKLVDELLSNNRDAIKEFNVLLFNVESFWWKPEVVANTPQNIKAFMKFANQLSLEGASDLSLAFSEIHKKEKAANIFLLSDGAATWGASGDYELSNLLSSEHVVFSYNTGMSGTGTTTLQHLARESGGAVFSVLNEDEIKSASKAFRNQPWKIEGLKINNTKDVIIAGRPLFIYPGQKLMIAGRFENQMNPNVELIVSKKGKKETLNIPIQHQLKSDLTSRTYGQIATEQLENFGLSTEKYAISYAKYFKIPRETCSLLMLETEADYEEYKINATEDQFVVHSTLVNDLIQDIINTLSETIGDPKANFIKWLEKLEKMSGVRFEKSVAIDVVCNSLSQEDFTVEPKGLVCLSRNKKTVSEDLKIELSKEKLDYSIINEAAQKRKENYGTNDALRLLSSLVEKNAGDGVLARDIAFTALEWDLNEQAYFLLKRVLVARPYEPQTYHAIAQALAQAGKNELALLYYEIAVSADWDSKFGEFDKIVSLDYLNFLKNISLDESFKLKDFAKEKINQLDEDFYYKEADLLVTISWNTDKTDVDLHVKEPGGEVCMYSNKVTKIGGEMTNDVTQGYGPEMYVLDEAKNGKYQVSVHYYSSDNNRTSTRTKVYATIYKNWGKENEEIIKKVVTLEIGKEIHEILELDIRNDNS